MTDLELAKHAAQLGANAIKRWSGELIHPEMKGLVDPVTGADRDAEGLIVELLGSQRPEDAILAEEGGGEVGPDRTWIIDPLDGTVNFVHGVPHVAVSIALFASGRPMVGVIHNVFTDDVYSAESGKGAFLNDATLSVSDCLDVGDALIATGFPYDRRVRASAYAADIERALRAVRGVRRMGSAALDLAFVAAGRFDGYWEYNLAPWDVAAGMLLVTEAGGSVSEITSGSLEIDGFSSILATNTALHDQLRAVLID